MMANFTVYANLEYQTEAWLGEGPVWDDIHYTLWWVDILSCRLHMYDPQKKKNRSFDVGEHIGAVALRNEGGLLLALKSGFYFFNDKTEEMVSLAEDFNLLPGTRFNDGICDPVGRFWAGTLNYELKKGSGGLYCLNTDLKVEKKLDGLTIPNGMAWNSAGNTFYFIDTIACDLYSFRFFEETGRISEKTVLIHFDEKDGYPDGMTIDSEDRLWIALYGGGKVIRFNPENMEIEYEIKVPVPKPTSCIFGGDNLKTLFITTCREHMNEEEIQSAPLSGSLFSIDLPFQGLPADRFKG